jgi:hypothetical protein
MEMIRRNKNTQKYIAEIIKKKNGKGKDQGLTVFPTQCGSDLSCLSRKHSLWGKKKLFCP